MITAYIISVLLCLVMFTAVAVNTSTVIPAGDRLGVVLVAAFLILCPIINTLIAVAGVASGAIVFFAGYK